MNVIIMAAGVGSRLQGLAGNLPKCLIRAGSQTLIRRVVTMCRERGLRRISVVTGYKADSIRSELGNLAHYYHNPFYPITNSLASLWFAREELVDDMLLLNADLFFEPKVLDAALAQTRPVVMLADSSRRATADYRFGINGDRVVRHGKQLTAAETDAEYVGIVRVDREFLPAFRERLASLIEAQRFNDWWEDVLYSQIPEGVPIHAHDVAGNFWTEIDCQADYDRLTDWLAAPIMPGVISTPLVTRMPLAG
jgi:choline kinase